MWRVAFRDTLASGLAMAVVARAVAVGEGALARLPCGLWLAKMERISEVLQCPVIVEGRGPRVLEPQLLEKFEGRADAFFPLPRGPTRLLNQMMLITST